VEGVHRPNRETKLDRIEEVTTEFLNRCFAFDQFGPLSIRPHHGSTWARQTKPARLPATYHRTHGIRDLHGCYSLGDDRLWGVTRRRTDLRDPGQPIRQQDHPHPGLGQEEQGRAVIHPDQRILGQPHRSPV
jgi:hypothetical protein